MIRTVYCMDESQMPDAEKMATEWQLAVQVGESGRTKELEFDRTKVQILQIPTERWVNVFPKISIIGHCISCDYFDEWRECSGLILLIESPTSGYSLKLKPWMTETHKATWKFRLTEIGEFYCHVLNGDNKIETQIVNVKLDNHGN